MAFGDNETIRICRIDQVKEEAQEGVFLINPALYEFYNVFPENTLKAGNSYDVIVQAYDRKNTAIKGAVCKFTVNA